MNERGGILVPVHLSDLSALLQTSAEVLKLLDAVGQRPALVVDVVAVRAARALVAAMVNRLTTLPHAPVVDPTHAAGLPVDRRS